MLERTTPVPNLLFDHYLPDLNLTELKVLLVIIRSTLGWVSAKGSSTRKERDWINGTQLCKRTGCSRRAITKAIDSLCQRRLIEVSDKRGQVLRSPADRKGKLRLYYRAKLGENPVKTARSTKEWTPSWARITQELAHQMRMY